MGKLPEKKCVHLVRNAEGTVRIYLDQKRGGEIWKCLHDETRINTTRKIIALMFEGRYVDGLYRRENINNKAANVTAMKYHSKNENLRIYCKEYPGAIKRIVLSSLPTKKGSQKVDRKLESVINSVADSNYLFEEMI